MNLEKYLNEGSNEVKRSLVQVEKHLLLAITQAKKDMFDLEDIEKLQDILFKISLLRRRF